MSKEQKEKNSDNSSADEKKDTRKSQKEAGENFSFLQETVKTKKKSGKSRVMQYMRNILYGIIFGIFACCSFFALKPWAEEIFYHDETKVTIPVEDGDTAQDNDSQDDADDLQLSTETAAEHYEEMLDSMYSIAEKAEKSVVIVQATEKGDWTTEAMNLRQSSGVIVGENSREILVLTDASICKEATHWKVTFNGKEESDAALKKQDKNRNIAVFSIDKKNVSDATQKRIEVATFGNSNTCKRGQVVIALGYIFGYDDGLSYGVISSKSQEAVFDDSQCQVLSTNISLAEGGTGILVNLKGEVLGLIRSDILKDTGSRTANALAISDLKEVLEMLLNGESIPYLGAYGSAVTEEISEQQNIPIGVYITNVQSDSPAMDAGIQHGDIIQEIKGMTVTGTASYTKAIEKCTVGETIKVCGQRRGSNGYVEVTYNVTIGSKE